jgi:hypothetical protein
MAGRFRDPGRRTHAAHLTGSRVVDGSMWAGVRANTTSEEGRVADLGPRWGQQRPLPPALEDSLAKADRRPLRAARDGLSLPDGCIEAEPGRVATVWAGQDQLGRAAVANTGPDAGLDPRDGTGRRGVTASLDVSTCPTKLRVYGAEMNRLNLERHQVRPDWNYAIRPEHLESLN